MLGTPIIKSLLHRNLVQIQSRAISERDKPLPRETQRKEKPLEEQQRKHGTGQKKTKHLKAN